MKTNEEKARAAASEWCRCHKCDGVARNLISENEPAVTFKCDKDKLQTCHKWYNGYRTALMALGKIEPISEEELENLAQKAESQQFQLTKQGYSLGQCIDNDFIAGFKAGYKALEKL